MDVTIQISYHHTVSNTNSYYRFKIYGAHHNLQKEYCDTRQQKHTSINIVQNTIVCIDHRSGFDVTCAEYVPADALVVNAGRFRKEPIDVLFNAGSY